MGIAERHHHVETFILEPLQVTLSLEQADYHLAVMFRVGVEFFHQPVMHVAQVFDGMLGAETGDGKQAVIPQVRRKDLRIPASAGQDFQHPHIRLDAEERQGLPGVAVNVPGDVFRITVRSGNRRVQRVRAVFGAS